MAAQRRLLVCKSSTPPSGGVVVCELVTEADAEAVLALAKRQRGLIFVGFQPYVSVNLRPIDGYATLRRAGTDVGFAGGHVAATKPRRRTRTRRLRTGWCLTTTYRHWGFGLCFVHLRNVQGFGWNHKRVYRIYRELELNLQIKPKKRLGETTPAGRA